jgi:PAS domain S-box-containing protein
MQGRLVLLATVAVLPFLALTAWRAGEHGARARAALGIRVTQAAYAAATRLDERARHVETLLAAVGPQLRADTAAAAVAANHALLLAVRQALPTPTVTALDARTPDGTAVGTSRRPLPAPERETAAAGSAVAEALAVGAAAVGPPARARGGVWSVPIAAPVAGPDGGVRLVVVAQVPVADLAPLVRAADLPDGARVLVTDARGTVVTAWPADTVAPGGAARQADAGAVAATARVRAAPWTVRVDVPGSATAGRAALARDLALGATALGLALLLAFAVARRIAGPVRALAAEAESLASGRPAHAPAPNRDVPGELAAIDRALAQLADTVAVRTAALHASEGRHRLLFEACPLPMYVVDLASFAFLAVNDAAVAQYGYTREEFTRLTLVDLRPAEDRLLFLAAARPGAGRADPARLEAGVWRHVRRDGHVFDVEVFTSLAEYEGRPARLSVAVDVTARRAAERALRESQEQLRRAQKMEALGRFAGGIAHDFNNLLTGILGAADLALSDLAAETPAREDVEMIRDSARRAAGLTGQILAFSRGGVVQPAVLSAAAVVNGLAPMLARVIGEHIQLVVQTPEPEPGGGHVTADRGQLEQIVMNLVLNARDAMPDGGTLALRVEDVDVGGESGEHPGVGPGAWVRLVVSDTGVGMDETTQGRIFEPFFTTKARGKGTGLGLATVYGIVTQAGGVVRVASARGVGSTFAIYLPRADVTGPAAGRQARRATAPGLPAVSLGGGRGTPPAAHGAVPYGGTLDAGAAHRGAPTGGAAGGGLTDDGAAHTGTGGADRPTAPPFGGGETVLIVEDDAAVRSIARAALTRRGYRVLTAGDAAEALAITRAFPAPSTCCSPMW